MKKTFEKCNNFLSVGLSENRSWLMGIAILLVTLYHLYCVGFQPLYMHIFRIGYVGVDIFILLSGYGLCHSWKNNDLKTFYKKRLVRVFPLYFISALFHTLFFNYILGNKESVWDWFCNLTTLSYYHLGGHHIEWYLSALLLFYLFFPIFYRIAKRNPFTSLFFLWCICGVITTFFHLSWEYNCLIARIPLFLFGIICYESFTANCFEKKKNPACFLAPCFCVFVIYLIYNIKVDILLPPFLGCCLAPLIITIALGIKSRLGNGGIINRFVSWIGGYTLEVYCSQICVMPIVSYLEWDAHDYRIVIVYFCLIILFSFLLALFNKGIKKIARII